MVDKNYAAIDRGGEYVQLTVKPEWANLPDDEVKEDNAPAFVKELVAAYEKRGVEAFVPLWNKDNCIQCNQCAYICPHAAIRPFVLTDDELAGFDGLETLEMKAPAAMKGMHFVIEPSVLDCLGCGNCADICPGNPKTGKALTMVPFNPDAADMKKMAADWDKLVKVPSKQNLVDIKSNVKNSQFAQPLFEFSGVPTLPVALLSTLLLFLLLLTPRTRRVRAQSSTTLCSRTSASSVSVWLSVTRR